MAADKSIIQLIDKRWKLSKGHQPHRSGAGKHGDRRLKRLGTRRARIVAAIDSY